MAGGGGTDAALVLATEPAGTPAARTPIAEVSALAQKKGGSAAVTRLGAWRRCWGWCWAWARDEGLGRNRDIIAGVQTV